MFNPHMHQQQQHQQQQQFQQHLRQLQQLFQQQPPPPPPPQPPPAHHVAHHQVHHHQHHQAQRVMPVPPQAAPTRMVNMCQATQTTIIAPNPMLQGALMMQQMQGNMRGFAMGGQMGGQQFRQFFAAGTRSSLLGPVPMGMSMKSHGHMGYPPARHYNPHGHDFAARQPDRKRDNEQRAVASTDVQAAAAASSTTSGTNDKAAAGGAASVAGGPAQPVDEPMEEPVVKKQRTEGSEEPEERSVAETDGEVLLSAEPNKDTEDGQTDDCILLEEGGSTDCFILEEGAGASTGGSEAVEALEEVPDGDLAPLTEEDDLALEETPEDQAAPLAPPGNEEEDMEGAEEEGANEGAEVGAEEGAEEGDEEGAEEGAGEGANKLYCYLCSITCPNQQNFKSHMNGIAHQKKMMEMLPRVQESLQGAPRDEEKRPDRWCATCQTHFTSNIKDHRRTEEHKLANKTAGHFCTVCKKNFRTSELFVEHMQTQEHKQRVDEDGWSSLTEVTLKNMSKDEQYDPGTVYGSSFLVPVAGFVCRLCNKFYHFESSAQHSHCKSHTHFENLKKYKALHSEKDDAMDSSRESFIASSSEENPRPVTETTVDCVDENGNHSVSGSDTHSADTDSVTTPLPKQPKVTITRLKVLPDTQQEEQQPGPTSTPQDLAATTSAPSTSCTDQDVSPIPFLEKETPSQAPIVQESPAEPLAIKEEEPDSMPVLADEDAKEEEEEEEKEASAVPGKKGGKGKAKAAPKRRSGRATCRR
ncbi:cdkn1a interacting zinc finger protein 1a [Diretmus argenteus]